jgi:carbon monoxide dehydrogenase subunit G
VVIAATPEQIGAVLHDADAAPRWTEGLERMEVTEGEPGVAGSVGLAHYEEGGRRYTMIDRLLEVDPGRYYRSEITGGGLRAIVETTLEPVAHGTRVTISWAGRGTNPVTTLLLAFMGSRVRQRALSDLEALRDLVEGAGGDDRS